MEPRTDFNSEHFPVPRTGTRTHKFTSVLSTNRPVRVHGRAPLPCFLRKKYKQSSVKCHLKSNGSPSQTESYGNGCKKRSTVKLKVLLALLSMLYLSHTIALRPRREHTQNPDIRRRFLRDWWVTFRKPPPLAI